MSELEKNTAKELSNTCLPQWDNLKKVPDLDRQHCKLDALAKERSSVATGSIGDAKGLSETLRHQTKHLSQAQTLCDSAAVESPSGAKESSLTNVLPVERF